MAPMNVLEETDLLPRVLLVVCGIGIMVAPAIYLAYVNVYAASLGQAVLGWMSLIMSGSGLLTVLFASSFDEFFDRRYGSKRTYPFRIGVGYLCLGTALSAVPFATEGEQVLLLGVCIGVFGGAALASLNQMASVVHPTFTKYVATGNTFGQALPIPLSLMLGFNRSDASDEAKVAFAWLPALLCFSIFVIFMLMACCFGVFDAVFDAMDDSLSDLADDPEVEPLMTSQNSSTRDADKNESNYSWFQWPISGCLIVQFVGNWISLFLMPFFTYFGNFKLAHDLVLARFAGELAGRCASLFIRLWAWGLLNAKGLAALLVIIGIRALMLIDFMMNVYRALDVSSTRALLGMVGLFYLLYAWSHSELNVLVVQVGPRQKNVELMRGMTLTMFSGQILGSAAATMVIQLFLPQ